MKDSVAIVSTLLTKSDARTWAGLFRIYSEIVESLGVDGIAKTGLVMPDQLRRFTYSLHAQLDLTEDVLLLPSDHAPPRRRMTKSEACAFVNRLAVAWLAQQRKRAVALR